VGPRTWPVHQDIGDAGLKHTSPLTERKQTHVETDACNFIETEETQVHNTCLWCWFHSNKLCFHACYQNALWAQRNSHFTWQVSSCGNGHCLIPVTMCWDTREIDASHFVKIKETHIHSRLLQYWPTIMGCVLVPVTKVPCGPRETTISRDRCLVVVTVIVLCPLRICLISNRHLPITFLPSFVTLDR
jgi:hypothetical protein